jgi:hypothetical protein
MRGFRRPEAQAGIPSKQLYLCPHFSNIREYPVIGFGKKRAAGVDAPPGKKTTCCFIYILHLFLIWPGTSAWILTGNAACRFPDYPL